MPLRMIAFDIGETLVDETPMWSTVADWVGVPGFTLMGIIGGLAARNEHHHHAFGMLGIDRIPDASMAPADLYPDALPCLARVRAAGLRVALAGNQPAGVEKTLGDVGEPGDLVASSGGLGVEKPDVRFFSRLAEMAQLPPADIAYVGDRVDNDIRPALAAGMRAVFLLRGPWAYLHQQEVPAEALRVTSLDELPSRLLNR